MHTRERDWLSLFAGGPLRSLVVLHSDLEADIARF